MRKQTAALAAALLLLTSACDHQTAAAEPVWEQPSPEVTFPALPAGLLATAEVGDHSELRIYSPANGHLIRKLKMPLVAGALTFSDDLGYAADNDTDSREIHFSVRRGDTFKAVTDWSIAMLDLQNQRDLQVRPEGFQPGTDRYTVEVDRPVAEGYSFMESVTFDPAQPTTTMRYDSSPPAVDGADGHQYVEVPSLHARADVDVVKRAPVSADIIADSTRAGHDPFFFSCGGRPIAKFELACFGSGDRAEVGALTVVPPATGAEFRLLGRLPGKPFTGVFASPDGKRLLAQRDDGFYSLPAGGGTPKKVFGGLPVTVLSWSGSR